MGVEIKTQCLRLQDEAKLSPKEASVITHFIHATERGDIRPGSRGLCMGEGDRKCPAGLICSCESEVVKIANGSVHTRPVPSTTPYVEHFRRKGINILIEGGKSRLEDAEPLQRVFGALILNCIYNRIPGSDKGATEIIVTFGENNFCVEDNFEYPNVDGIINRLNDFVASDKSNTTKMSTGGMGIYQSVNELREINGGLEYYTNGKTVGVKVYWENVPQGT